MSAALDGGALEIAPQPGPQTILLATMGSIQEVFYGGALGSGKSYGLGLALENQHQKYGGHVSGIIFRQSVPELDQLIRTFKEILTPFGWEWKEGKKEFHHPDGAVCRMRHCEDDKDVRKYWGQEYTLMAVDELGDMPEKTFNAYMKIRAARLRSAKGVPVQFIGTGNPCGLGHKLCKERYIDPAPAFTPHKDPRSKHNIMFIPGHMENNVKMLMNDPEYRQRCASMGPDWYVNALINGDWSISPEGNMFHRSWFDHRYDPNNLPDFDFKVISWDTAFKTTKDSAESAYTCWGVTDNKFYLLDAWSGKLEFPALKRKAVDVYNFHNSIKPGVYYNWIEDKASGQDLIPSLTEETSMPLKGIKVDGDKLRRAFAVTSYFESGRVLLPLNAPWVDKYIEQLTSFPAPTGYADLVDSTSQGITEISRVRRRFDFFSESNVIPVNFSIYER